MMEKNNNLMVKSGTDFRNLTKVIVDFTDVAPGARPKLSWEEHAITKDLKEDRKVKKVGQGWDKGLEGGP